MDLSLPFTDVVLTIVKPLHKTGHIKTIDPISIDIVSSDAYVPLFFAYRLGDNSHSTYLQLSKRLRESLGKVLVPFFSYAGRWVASPDSLGNRQLLCNDEGVMFTEAYLDRDLDSVVHTSAAFQPVPELQGYDFVNMDMTQFRQEMQPEGLPCIFVQVTRFKCGGLVLAVTFNHMHTDGKGFFDFMTAWSDFSISNKDKTTTIAVEHNRALAEKESFKTFISREKTTKTPASSTVAAGSKGEDGPIKVEGLRDMKSFEVSAQTIKSLKQEAKDCNIGGAAGFASNGDCIIAHFWKALSKVPSSILGGNGNVNANVKKELAISMAVEGRNRFYHPPLPNLCGNAVAVMLAPIIPSTELQQMSVAAIACKIREKLMATTTDEWLGFDRLEEALLVSKSPEFARVRVTSWYGFPMYDIDFGFGRPFFVSGVNTRFMLRDIGTIIIAPAIPSSLESVATVSIMSSQGVIEALERDLEFLLLSLPPGKAINESSVSV
ncbi:unnamed protein product [Calypogeia fissa]